MALTSVKLVTVGAELKLLKQANPWPLGGMGLGKAWLTR
jgi:hypothetical protein